VQLTTGTHLDDQYAVLTITITNLLVTDIATGGHYTLNGTHYITNETGGLAWQVLLGLSTTTVAHRHTGDLQLTFADNTQRTWTIDRTRTFKNTGGVASIELSSEAANSVDATGTNKDGNTFTNAIPTTIVANANPNCPWKPYTGEYTHHVANRTATVVFGVNSAGTSIGSAATSSTDCALMGYMVTYTNGTHTRTRFVGYSH